MEQQNVHEEVICYGNDNTHFEFKQKKSFSAMINPSNANMRTSDFRGQRGNGNGGNWQTQNGQNYQPFNGRRFNKENQRSRSRSQGRDNSENDQRNNIKTFRNNEKFENRPQRYGRPNPMFRQNNYNDRSKSPQGYQNFQNQRFNQNNQNENIISKPTLAGPLKSFDKFMESQRIDIDSEEAERVYQDYKKNYEEKQNAIFFAEHKNEEWFKEKYDKVLAAKFNGEKREEARLNAEMFFANLENGVYDSVNLNYEDYDHKNLMNKRFKPNDQMEEEKDALRDFTELDIEANHNITGAPLFGFDANSKTLFIQSIPKFISRWDLTEPLKKLHGFQSLSMSEPLKNQEYSRLGWIIFDNEYNCNVAYEHLKTLNIKGFAFSIIKARPQPKSIKISENVDQEKMRAYIQLSSQLIEALDKEKNISNELLQRAQGLELEKQLDLQVLYLRKAHAYCLYCAAEYADERMLASKCGPIHLRKGEGENRELFTNPDWHKKICDSIKGRIQESGKKPKHTLEQVEKKVEEEFDNQLRSMCQKLSKQGNWPCKFCPKIFKEDHYIIKHIKTKHEDQYQQLKEKKTLENYANDKNRLTFRYQSQQHFKPQGQGFKPNNNNFNTSRNARSEYRDLDDPKVIQVRTARPIIDYGDL